MKQTLKQSQTLSAPVPLRTEYVVETGHEMFTGLGFWTDWKRGRTFLNKADADWWASYLRLVKGAETARVLKVDTHIS